MDLYASTEWKLYIPSQQLLDKVVTSTAKATATITKTSVGIVQQPAHGGLQTRQTSTLMEID